MVCRLAERTQEGELLARKPFGNGSLLLLAGKRQALRCCAAPCLGAVAEHPVNVTDCLFWRLGLLQQLPKDAPVLILLPGLTGGSGDSYVQHAVVRL